MGNVLEDFTPAVNPPQEIDDPEDSKPEDWVDTKRIPDPDATKVMVLMIFSTYMANMFRKPDDWDEDAPYEIPDEDAIKPEGWLDDEPEFIPDPGMPVFRNIVFHVLTSVQTLRSPRSGTMKKTVTGLLLQFVTRSVTRLPVAASGSGMCLFVIL